MPASTKPVYTRLDPADIRVLRREARRERVSPAALLKRWAEREIGKVRTREQKARNAAKESAA